MIKAVIFDLDGTLIQLPIDYEKLFREFKNITKIDNIQPLVNAVSKLDGNTREKVFRVWNNAELVASEKMIINKDGIEIYEKFSQKPKALVTMQGRTIVKTILEKLGLSFDVIVTREDSLNRVAQLQNAAKKLRTQVQSLLFVGNTENDFLAAEKLGCQFLRIK